MVEDSFMRSPLVGEYRHKRKLLNYLCSEWEQVFPACYGRLHNCLFFKVFKVCYLIDFMKLSKKQAEERIKEFFKNIESKKPDDARKIKRLAMHNKIKLGSLKKKFCKKCYSVFCTKNSQTKIKKGFKVVKCLKCGFASRWKIKHLLILLFPLLI